MMNNQGRKKIWFTIEEFKSQLVTDIKRCEITTVNAGKTVVEPGFAILIKHPNSGSVLSAEEVPVSKLKDKSNPWAELAEIGLRMKSIIKVDTDIQAPIKKSPAPKKGKMNTNSIINH